MSLSGSRCPHPARRVPHRQATPGRLLSSDHGVCPPVPPTSYRAPSADTDPRIACPTVCRNVPLCHDRRRRLGGVCVSRGFTVQKCFSPDSYIGHCCPPPALTSFSAATPFAKGDVPHVEIIAAKHTFEQNSGTAISPSGCPRATTPHARAAGEVQIARLVDRQPSGSVVFDVSGSKKELALPTGAAARIGNEFKPQRNGCRRVEDLSIRARS